MWHGMAELMRGHWPEARDALERSVALGRERWAATDAETMRLGMLAEAYLGLGEPERARRLAQEGIEAGRASGVVINQLYAILALAKAMFASPGELAQEEVEAELERGLRLARESESKAVEPLIRVELAELARRRGDEEGRERELREAQRLFTEIGASGHAARLATELQPARS